MLLLAGSGEEQETLKALAQSLGVAAHIRFLGQRADVAELVAGSDLFVLPSLFEGLPLVVLEAMSLGTPVVATRIGGTLEALGEEHPFFAVPGDVQSLADTIILALADPIRLAGVGAAAGERFRQLFSADRMAAETGAIYGRFAGKSGPTQKDLSMQKLSLIHI